MDLYGGFKRKPDATIASVVRKLEAFGILPILKILGLFRN